MQLSILIPTLVNRHKSLRLLLFLLNGGISNPNVEIITATDRGEMSIGAKRNWLLDQAKGDYISSVDDDDTVVTSYINLLLAGIASNPDCCSLRGIITWDGINPELFEHSIKYKEYKTTENEIKYERYPNHLNCIRADIAKQFKFQETNHGEDTDWATQIFKSGLLKTEYYIEQVLYYYQFKPKK